MLPRILFTISIIIIIFSSCNRTYEFSNGSGTAKHSVQLKKEKDGYKLYRNGEPYFIKGAGGSDRLDLLKASGGNSVRTWNTKNAKAILDSAHALGLTVTLGLEIGRPRLGFDYGDEKAREQQLKWVREEVLKYKDHPALLMGAIGNEVTEAYGDEIQIWKGVNEIAELVHQLDKNHPTTTMIAPKTATILHIKYLCPEIDILSINTFGALSILSDKLRRPLLEWDGAYIVSEWGPKGHWETDSTTWSVAIEQTSTEKAEFCRKNYKYIENDKERCLGSYTFFWGHKQERTATWFSLFSNKGEKTQSVDVMGELWQGKVASNRSPVVGPITVNGKFAKENVIILANSDKVNVARIDALDFEQDSLEFFWQLMYETKDLRAGGDGEFSPDEVPGVIKTNYKNTIEFNVPKQEGAYRLYVYVTDGKDNIATANFPFYVLFP